MLPRPMRTLVAVLATLGLALAISAVPAAAVTCAATGSATEDVAQGLTLTFDGDFACADAADSGEWSITVNVTNDSDTELTISAVTLSHITPSLQADAASAAAATADATGLPLTLAAGAAGSFDVSGDYTLAQVGAGGLLNVHLRATGTTGEEGPFTLGINVHLLGPGVELDDADAEAGAGAGAGVAVGGAPDWVPGPPSWVRDLLADLFAGTFPWGTDDFPPAVGAGAGAGASTDATAQAAGGVDGSAGATLPAHVTLPAGAAASGAAAAESDAEADADADSDAGAAAGVRIGVGAGASGEAIVPPIGGRP